MHFSQRLLQILHQPPQDGNLTLLSDWSQEFSKWLSSHSHNSLIDQLQIRIQRSYQNGQTRQLLDFSIWLEDNCWRCDGPTSHGGTNRIFRAFELGNQEALARQCSLEIYWTKFLARQVALPANTAEPGQLVRSRSLLTLKAEHDSFRENYLALLEATISEQQTGELRAQLRLEELAGLASLYQSIDLRGFCSEFQFSPTPIALLNCLLHSAWQVHHNYISDRIFLVLREQFGLFGRRLQSVHRELSQCLPVSIPLQNALERSEIALKDLIDLASALEASDLLSHRVVQTKTQQLYQSYLLWSKIHQEIWVLSPVRHYFLRIDRLLLDCQAVLFEDESIPKVSEKLFQIVEFCDRLLYLSKACKDQEMAGFVGQVKRRLDYIQLFLDQPKAQTLRLLAPQFEEQFQELFES